MWPSIKVFLSHSALDAEVSERVHVALVEAGLDVFFDRSSLPVGEEFHDPIREEIAACDVFLFLASKNSLRPGCYCLTELKFVEERWPDPDGRFVPVLLEPLGAAELPAYVTAVTYLVPRGNLVAETVSAVAAIAAKLRRRRRARALAGAAALIALAVAGVLFVRRRADADFVRPLPASLRHRVRVATASAEGTRPVFVLAADDPPELVELSADGGVQVVGKLDAEPVALSCDADIAAVATRSSKPLHLFVGPERDPREPLEVQVYFDDPDLHPLGFAKQPVALAVHDGRVWIATRDGRLPPAFQAYTPENDGFHLPFFGHYPYESMLEYGRSVDGARLCVVGERLFIVRPIDGHSVVEWVLDKTVVLRDEPGHLLACARDLAAGPGDTLVFLACDDQLTRVVFDRGAMEETRVLSRIDHRAIAENA